MKTIWTKSGNAINIREAKEASMSTMIQFEYLNRENRQVEAALLLVENLIQFKEDLALIKEMSAEEFGEFMEEWIRDAESA